MSLFIRKKQFFIVCLSTCFYSLCLASPVEEQPDVVVKIHNVGQGNCVTLAVEGDNHQKSYVMIDAGTSSFQKEMIYQQNQSPVKQDFRPMTTPSSTVTAKNYKAVVDDEDDRKSKKPNIEDNFIKNFRQEFGAKTKISNLHFKTAIITHPDTDHYNLLNKLFYHAKDKIDHISFSGLPECYDSKGTLGLRKWIDRQIQNGSQVFFPTIRYTPIKSFSDVLPTKERLYASPFHTLVEGQARHAQLHLQQALKSLC